MPDFDRFGIDRRKILAVGTTAALASGVTVTAQAQTPSAQAPA